jgi:uncharacterized protein involved in exopolysaccharide biosynthesis
MSVDLNPNGPVAVRPEPLPAPVATGGISLMGMVNVLLLHRWLLVIIPAMAVLVAVVPLFLKEREYRSEAALMPQDTDVRSGVAGLAAQFGIDVGSGKAGQSSAFYADFLTSSVLLGAVADAGYTHGSGPTASTVSYADLRDIRAATPQRRRELTIRSLRAHTTVRNSRETGIVRISVETPSPQVSQQVVDRMLSLVNEFNLTTRQSQAAAERQFVEARLAEVRGELQEAEGRLQEFLQQNRQFRSPELQAEHERLQSEVMMRRQVFTSLTQAYEQARIDEVRNTPLITVIESPAVPAAPVGRGVFRAAMIGGMIGLLVAVFIAFARAAALRAHEAEIAEYERYSELRRQVIGELLWPVRALRGGSSSSKPSRALTGPDAG